LARASFRVSADAVMPGHMAQITNDARKPRRNITLTPVELR
jgi:hypothetical protein